MALTTTTTMREIYSLVRKDRLDFDVNDRIPLSIKTRLKNGNEITYSIGSLYYDYDSGNVCFDLYNNKGQYIPSSTGLRSLRLLGNDDLVIVKEKAQKYRNMAIMRKKCIDEIQSFVISSGAGYKFSNPLPEISIVKKDSSVENYSVVEVFNPDVSPFENKDFYVRLDNGDNVNLTTLLDSSILSIHNVMNKEMKMRKIETQKVSNSYGVSL